MVGKAKTDLTPREPAPADKTRTIQNPIVAPAIFEKFRQAAELDREAELSGLTPAEHIARRETRRQQQMYAKRMVRAAAVAKKKRNIARSQ